MAAHHQAEFMSALVSQGHEVTWVVDQFLTGERRAQGWPSVSVDGLRLLQASPADVSQILSVSKPDLCVFAPRGCEAGPILVRELGIRGLPYAFMMELPGGSGPLVFLKKILHKFFFSRAARPRFTLAMGLLARRFYHEAGYPLVVPFGYTVPASMLTPDGRAPGPYRIVYLGQLIRRKRVDLVLRALAQAGGDWHLDIVGGGSCRANLAQLASDLGIASRLSWISFMDNASARVVLASADTLVLPSESEGWGAVVNEALAEGSRVIVSSACGSSCLTKLNKEDMTFQSRSVSSLAAAIQVQLALGGVSLAERQRRRLSHQRIDGRSMAAYFTRIASGDAPAAPWDVLE